MPDNEARRKPAIRTLTVRYVLTLLKYSAESGKIDILKQRPLCAATFAHLRNDPSDIVLEILRISEQNVFKDSALPRSAKAALLTSQHLERVTEVATRLDVDATVADAAFAWLKAAVTVPSYGILRESGWYPPGSTKLEHITDSAADSIDLGLDSLEFYDRPESFQVRNTTLLAWITTLRPQSDMKERELALACFRSAPELVRAYFDGKGVQLDPKLTNTWIGYASLLFEIVALPVPSNFGLPEEQQQADIPPQVTIVMDSILPRPLSPKVLTRCLNQSSPLITFFAVRILVLAFRKFEEVHARLEGGAATAPYASLWKEASARLADQFASQVPKMKDMMNAFRQVPDDKDHVLQKEASSRLLKCYYETIPQVALEEPFDVSGPLTEALEREETSNDADVEIKALRSLELEHLLVVAQYSAGMRWFSTQGGLKFSPCATLLRLHARQPNNPLLRKVIGAVMYENIVLAVPSNDDVIPPLDALVASFVEGSDKSDAVWAFVDDCLARYARQPVKYLDSLEASEAITTKDVTRPSLLLEVIREQAPFAADKLTGSAREEVLTWITNFLALLTLTSDKGTALDDLASHTMKRLGRKHVKPSDKLAEALALVRIQQGDFTTPEVDASTAAQEASLPFALAPTESESHPKLLRWQKKDLEIAIDDGDIDAVVLCLCSRYPEIRRQAVSQLNILTTKLETSDLETKDQLRILLGELLETYKYYTEQDDSALPYLGGTFAVRSLHVLQDPAHLMYAKLNNFLMKSPEWRVSKLPNYWLDNTILAQPEEDDGYWKEVQWVLDWLVDGLRGIADMDILRKAGVFERVMAVCQSPAASDRFVKMKVLELVYRATNLDANTLVTRAGCLAWLDMGGEGSVQRALKRRVLELADGERVNAWAGVGVVS